MENETARPQPMPHPWFPYTKLQPPQPGNNHVSRSWLQQTLTAAVRQHKLTLIAAPAGSGKTILSTTLAHSNLLTAWIALDETDNDLPLFVALLAAALRPWLKDEGQPLLAFVQTVPYLPEKTAQLAALLINTLQISANPPLVLILDDYHVITDPAIHQLLSYLLDYLPDSLRLLIATRHDPPLPLPRLRARGQLAEMRLPLLCFTEEETSVFLNQRHHLHLAAAEVATLHQRTGGWAAGLQLLAAVLSTIEAEAERTDYIQQFTAANQSIFEVLVTEVLAHQPPDIQEFLLQTSVLTELTAAACQAVTRNPAAPQLLAAVYQRNLFLRALTPDAHNGPFRYHDLFRHFLQQQLQKEPQLWIELHHRAAQAARSDEQKLHHLTRAELWAEAAQLLETMAQLDAERRFTRNTVIAGIESLPVAVQLAHPWLLLFVGQYYAIRGQVEAAAPWLAQAAARFQEEGDELGEIEILAARAMTDTLDSAEIVHAYRQKIAAVGHLLRPDQWSIYHGAELWYAMAIQDWEALADHLQANITRALESGDPGSLTMTSLTIGPHMLFSERGMSQVAEFVAHSLPMAGANDWILQICGRGLSGFMRFYQGRLEEADAAAHEAYRLLQEIGGLGWIDDHVSWLILDIALARRAYHHFDEFWEGQAARWAVQDTAVNYQQGFMYLRGRALCLRQRIAEAQEVLAQMQAITAPTGYELEDKLRRLLLASHIAIARGETGAAKRDLHQAITLHEKVRHTVMLTHPRLLLATLYGQQNRWHDALNELRLVLKELKARQMPGVILQEGESIVPVLRHAIEQGLERVMLQPLLHILQPDDTSQVIPLPNSEEYLTARESEVLRLLATGATNPAIAAALSITERTVKAHVTRILAKLDASTRTEAVSKASRLGLL